jgi:hypothetical protein
MTASRSTSATSLKLILKRWYSSSEPSRLDVRVMDLFWLSEVVRMRVSSVV